jgi:hypothetical protein
MTSGFRVKVNGSEESVYHTELGDFCQFEGGYPASVEIWCDQDIDRVDIRPKSRAIAADLGERKIAFMLSAPMKLSIEINEDLAHPLFLFADSPEDGRPDPEDPKVKYYKSGQSYDAGEIELADNETLYIERGAVVNGCIIAKDARNVSILGRGVLDASQHQNATQILGCDNVVISGITLVKGGIEWVNRIFCCTNVHIRNYKGISWGRYSDGIDLLGCKHVLVEDVFVRSEDDSICIKSNKFGYCGDVEDILIRDSVIWNGLSGNAIDIGYETDTDHIRDITFRNLDIIRTDKPKESWWRRSALSIHHAGNSAISGVRFEDIRIEAAMESLIYFELVTSTPEWGEGGGTLADIYLKDVRLIGGPASPSIIRGLDSSVIKGITFNNFVYHGKRITDEQGAIEAGFDIGFAEILWG